MDQTGNAGLMTTAKFDLVTAYLNAAGRLGATPVGTELGGTTLVSGVYSSGTFGITAGAGALILDGQGNPNAVWVFKADSTLITGSASTVSLINGADACNVFWQIGSSATLGTGSLFVGNLLALTSITVTRGVTVDGRVLARNGAVTLDTDTIAVDTDCIPAPGGGGPGGTAVPDSGSTLLLLSSVFATLVPLRRHFLPRLNS